MRNAREIGRREEEERKGTGFSSGNCMSLCACNVDCPVWWLAISRQTHCGDASSDAARRPVPVRLVGMAHPALSFLSGGGVLLRYPFVCLAVVRVTIKTDRSPCKHSFVLEWDLALSDLSE